MVRLGLDGIEMRIGNIWGRKSCGKVGRDGVGWLGIALILGREGGVKRWILGRWGEMVRR